MTLSVRFSSPESPAPANVAMGGTQTAVDEDGPPADPLTGETAQILFTPGEAARLLQVRESWLRRRAARRAVPCTFLGKHLRFSRHDVEQIATAAAQPAKTSYTEVRSTRRHSASIEHI
jgi:excisionase family DNA binding protein